MTTHLLSRALLTATLLVTVIQRHTGGIGGDAYDYIDAASNLTGSRFPPGFPLLLAPIASSWWMMELLALAIALGLVAAIYRAAVHIGGWWAGVAASVLMLLSPAITHGGAAIMSDRLGALLVVGGLLAILHERPVLAGLLVGLSGWVRLVHVALCAVLPRRAWPAAVVTVGLLVAWQMFVKGSLLGYTSDAASFAVGNITGQVALEQMAVDSPYTNLGYFPVRLFGLESMVTGALHTDHLAPFLILPAVVGLRRWWGDAARFAVLACVVNLAVYLPYFFQSARFVLPGGCLLTVFAAAAFSGTGGGKDEGDQTWTAETPSLSLSGRA